MNRPAKPWLIPTILLLFVMGGVGGGLLWQVIKAPTAIENGESGVARPAQELSFNQQEPEVSAPPRIEIRSPKIVDGQSSHVVVEATLSLTLELHDQGGGLGPVLVTLNSQSIDPSRGVARVDKAGDGISATAEGQSEAALDARVPSQARVYNLGLSPGSNTLLIVAYTIDGIRKSERIQHIEFQPDFNLGRSFALMFAVGNYPDPSLNSLFWPIPDAKDLREVLIEEYEFTRETVQLVENPDRGAVLDGFKWLKGQVGPNDQALVFFGGHGHLDEQTDEGYWFLTGASADDEKEWFSFGRLKNQLEKIDARHMLVLVDSCHAGGILRSPVEEVIPESWLESMTLKSRRAITRAPATMQVPDKSPFMQNLIAILKSSQDDFLPSRRLHHLVFQRLDRLNATLPESAPIPGLNDLGGDITLIRKDARQNPALQALLQENTNSRTIDSKATPPSNSPSPVPSPPETPLPGYLTVTTDPQGARVFAKDLIGERLLGVTPLTRVSIQAGSYSIRIEKDDYDSIIQDNVTIQSRSQIDFGGSIRMRRSRGTLRVGSEPTGSTFLLKGKELEESLFLNENDSTELLTGSYILELERKGWKKTEQVYVKFNELTHVTVVFDYGGLSISSTPSGADIRLKGSSESLGTTPYQKGEWRPGSYEFVIDHPSGKYEPRELELTIVGGITNSIPIILNLRPKPLVPVQALLVGGKKREYVEKPVEGERFVIPGLGMTYEWIPAGVFKMGSPADEPGRFGDEGPQRQVTLSRGYWLSTYEVTQKLYEELMGTNPSHFKKAGLNAPIESVSWEEAVSFCERLTERERKFGRLPLGFEYGLPSEAEWEYACRGGTETALYTGGITIKGENNAPELNEIAWYGGNSGVRYEGAWDSSGWPEKEFDHKQAGTHEVGLKKANAFGLHDMLGNVWEWTSDWSGPYEGKEVVDPGGPKEGSYRVVRGGSWFCIARFCRAAFRSGVLPSGRDNVLGFRPALRSSP